MCCMRIRLSARPTRPKRAARSVCVCVCVCVCVPQPLWLKPFSLELNGLNPLHTALVKYVLWLVLAGEDGVALFLLGPQVCCEFCQKSSRKLC